MIAHAIIHEISLLLVVALGIGAFAREAPSTGRLNFCLLAAAVALTALGNVLSIREFAPPEVALRVRLLGLMVVPAFWLGFAAHVAHLDIARRLPSFAALLLFPSAILYGFLMSDRFGLLFYAIDTDGTGVEGPLYTVQITYGFAIALLGSVTLVSAALRSSIRRHYAQRAGILLAAALPIAGALSVYAGFVPKTIDPLPWLLALAMLLMRSGIEATGLLEALPVPPREILHQLPVGILLADANGCVVEISDTASNRLGVFEANALGQPLDDLLERAHVDRALEKRTVEFRQRNQLAGRMVVLQ